MLRLALYAVVIAALCAPSLVPAQATGNAPAAPTLITVKKVGDTATVFWTAPSTYSDGTALGSVALSYTVYSAAPGGAWKAVNTGTALTWTTAALLKGSACFAITDSVAGLESVASPPLCIGVGVAGNPPGAAGIR